jgi:hypothetical protein
MARGFVKDSMEHVGGVLSLSCAVRCDRVAHYFAIVVDAGQQSLLSYCMDLGLTAGVASWTIHRVYFVIQYTQVGYSLGSPEFCEWGEWYMGLIWRVISVVSEGAVPSCCCAVLCHRLALGTFGGSRGIWTLVGAQVGRCQVLSEKLYWCAPLEVVSQGG